MTIFARNTVFANIVLLIIFLAGGLATRFMVCETFPEISLEMISISVAYPGADPEEVEEGVCRKIEEAVEGIEGIKQVVTRSNENIGTAYIEVKEKYDVNDVLDSVRSKVEAISTFPVDAEKPIITEMVIKDPVMFVYLSGETSERRLKEWAEDVRDDLQQLPEISQVDIFGARDYEITIEVSEERLQEYGLTFDMVADAVRRSNLNQAGGTIRTKGEEIRVRTVGRKYTGKEISSIVVLAGRAGNVITLDRLANIYDGFTEDPITATINGEPSLMVMVYKTSEEDSIAISRAVSKYVAQARKLLPEGLNIDTLYDGTEILKSRIDLLVKNGVIGLCLVFFTLWLFLDTRLSFWAGMGIPISLAGAMAILWAMGATINMISLFGMIMVLGIVVDDAIVVGEAIFVHRKHGKPPLKAAVDGVCEVGMPVFAAVATTIAAFIPLAYVGGTMGKFIVILPTVVISCLVVSLVECFFLLPAHLSRLPDLNAKTTIRNRYLGKLEKIHLKAGLYLERFVDNHYVPFLSKTLNRRYVSFCVAVSILLVVLGFMQGGFLKFQVFPEVDGFVVTSTIEFPNGTPPAVTKNAVQEVEAALLRLAGRTETRSGEPLLVNRLTIVGQTLGDMGAAGPHLGAVQAVFLDSAKRGIHSKDLSIQWEKEVGVIPGVISLTFEGLAHGPPGAPIEVWLQGHDMDENLAASDELMERLKLFDGVYQVRSDFNPGKNEIRLKLKPEARTLGITVDDLAGRIFSGYYGREALRLQRGRDDIRVKIRYTALERSRISDLSQVRIRTKNGYNVPLHSVADISYGPGYSMITRTDGMRRVAVSANVDTNKANAGDIFSELSSSFFEKLEKNHPGIRVSLQGEKKKMRESFGSLMIGFPLAMMGIFAIVATMFRSYIQPLIILFTVPFGLIGAIMGHLLLGYDLSMMSIFGMVALSGVVINDAIVLIERINENLAQRMSFFEAITNGGKRRFRAIFLTSVSTVGGLMPLILETDLQARFLIPMALSIAGGVAFATVLTLVLIPSLLTILNDFRRIIRRAQTGAWPTREEVEPALSRLSSDS